LIYMYIYIYINFFFLNWEFFLYFFNIVIVLQFLISFGTFKEILSSIFISHMFLFCISIWLFHHLDMIALQ